MRASNDAKRIIRSALTRYKRKRVREKIADFLAELVAEINGTSFEHLYVIDEASAIRDSYDDVSLGRFIYYVPAIHPAELSVVVAIQIARYLSASLRLAGKKVIVCDLDNTLWDVLPAIRRAEQAMYAFLAERYPRAVAAMTIEEMRDARVRVSLDFPHMAHDFSFLRQQALREQAAAHGYPQTMAEEAFDVFIEARNQVELYAEVRPALEWLHPRYRLFTASNGNADLVRIGLAPLFERSVAARDVGALKPHPAVYLKVLEGTGLEAAQVLFVGDDPEHDVAGARRVGMPTVWMNRTAAVWPQDLEPATHAVSSLTELADLLVPGA
jgi:putative hydrolase of the HAD superfamily